MEKSALRVFFSISVSLCTLIVGCNAAYDEEPTRETTTEVFYFPEATVRSVGVDTSYKTVDNFRFVVPKEWRMLQSSALWSIDKNGDPREVPSSLEPRFSELPGEAEQLLIARQFNIMDPALVVSLSLIRSPQTDTGTQQSLREYVNSPEYLSDTEQFRIDVMESFEGNSDQAKVSWIDGGAKYYGEWICLFSEVRLRGSDGADQVSSQISCPAGARVVQVNTIISFSNADVVRDEISKFIASMDVSSTDWDKGRSQIASER